MPHAVDFADLRSPIGLIRACGDESVKAGVGPIAYRAYQPVFYRIEMDVFDVPDEIGFIAQHVLPIAMLPKGLFMFRLAPMIGYGAQGGIAVSGEPGLDQSPARGKIGIARRQGPDAMQMIG